MSEADRVKWDERYRDSAAVEREPSSFVVFLEPLLPREGCALDLAGGAGRHALWLARRGLAVTVVDVSPVGLARARAAAVAEGLDIETIVLDLDKEDPPPGPWDLVLSFHYLQRRLFPVFPGLLAPGGLLVYAQPTRRNLERNPRPPAPFLLEDGELPRLVQGLEVLRYDEGWSDGRHEARLAARKSAG